MTFLDIETVHSGRRFVVQRCRRERDGARVVVKRLRSGEGDSYGARSLSAEHEILQALTATPERPRISEPIEFHGPDRGGPALVLADAGPTDLRKRLGHRTLDMTTALSFGIELARVLSYLHGHHILHRDINPSNIVVGADGHLALVDFDAATRVIGLSPDDVPSELTGTLHYIAPEQTGRMGRGVDHRADLYAAGATLYEMLTGSPPFAGSDAVALVHAHLARTPVAPATINPRVPRLLSDLALKLLAKNPDHRYQTADALAHDLEEARERWRETGTISRFELGRADVRGTLAIAQGLYGRRREIESLTAAVTRAGDGARELIVLRGPAGSGKSSLIAEVARTHAGRATFTQGKAGQGQGNHPHAAWKEAVGPLLTQILDAGEPRRSRWKRLVLEATGRDAALLTELCPDLAALLGPQPAPPPSTGAAMRETRFRRAFVGLIRTLAAEYRPLVLSFDDLQWIDPASLSLLHLIAAEGDCPHLLVIAIYRDDELPATHPMHEVVAAAGEREVPVHTHDLGALGQGDVTSLLGDTLKRPEDEVRSLARVVLAKTAGNALFVHRFLYTIHQRDWLTFDATRNSWSWDEHRIARAEATENVVALMRDAIRNLPAETQEVLRAASCFRGWIDLELLAEITDADRERVARSLWRAVEERLLVGRRDQAGNAYYRFEHDRVQETAYALLGAEERQAIHMSLARRLLERYAQHPDGEIFEVVEHLGHGAALIRGEGERHDVARLHAEAGARARAANAYRAALAYFHRGIALLGGGHGAWEVDRELAFRLHREGAECAYLLGEYAQGDALVETARPHESSPFDSAGLANLQVIAMATRGDMEGALRRGMEGLAGFGIELPGDIEEAWEQELASVRDALSELRKPVIELERLRDPTEVAIMELLSNLLSPAFVTSSRRFAFLVGRMVARSVQHGNCVYSAFAYAGLGMVIGTLERDYRTAHELGRTGAALAEAFDDPVQECRTLHILGCFINHWRAPLRSTVSILRRGIDRGIEGGELQFAVYASTSIIVSRYQLGDPLDEISAEAESFSALAGSVNVKAGQEYLTVYRQAIRSLKGSTPALGRFDDDSFDEAAYLESCGGNPVSLVLYHVLRLQTAFLARQLGEAEESAAAIEHLIGAVGGLVSIADYRYFHSLVIAAAGGDDAIERVRGHQEDLTCWADNSPENFLHASLLVEAELARLEGRAETAAVLYDQAIDAAEKVSNERDAAVACELAARFWATRRLRRVAELYLRSSLARYARWGANAKVVALEHEFLNLAPPSGASWRVGEHSPGSATLDLMALHKAYETLSSEVVLERLVDKLVSVSMEVAGATGAALLFEHEGSLVLRASAPANEPPDVHQDLVERARAANEPVAVGDLAQARALGLEAAMRRGRAQSLLAVPIHRGSRAIGVLYLENRLTTHAFTAERVRVLRMLASQASISLENSMLFEGLSVEIAERKRAEESLGFLADASAQLGRSLDQDTILESLVHLPVPFAASWCIVQPVRNGEVSTEGAFAHPAALGQTPLHSALRAPVKALAREALSRGDVRVQELSDADRGHLPPGTRAVFAVPLVARERNLGVLSGGTSKALQDGDRVILRELAHRAAFALDNARLYAQSQEAVGIRDEFLSIASHELNTPLTSLRLASQKFLQGAVDDPARDESFFRMARVLDRQTGRLAKLVEDLLNVSRIHAGRLELTLETVNLGELVTEVLERFETPNDATTVSVSRRNTGPVVGRWNRARLDQVVTNLVSNALKFGAGGPIEIETSVAGERALLTVTDHGIGIESARLNAIFDRFERAVPSSRYGGLGLGLYIAKEIVSALGGAIHVESEPEVRTTFVVELPLAGPPPSAPPASTRSGHAPGNGHAPGDPGASDGEPA